MIMTIHGGSWIENLLQFLWPVYMSVDNEHDPRLDLLAYMRQKLFRRVADVPCPVNPSSVIKSPYLIHRESGTPGLGVNCYSDGRKWVELGANIWIGPYVRVISMNHDVNVHTANLSKVSIRIDKDSWIGTGATALHGVYLGPHTVVGLGAVVSKSFPGGDQVLTGNPAKIVKRLEPYRG